MIAAFNIRLAKETEDLALEPETICRGVEALFEDPSRGLYFVAESPETAEVAGQIMITYEWSDWRNGNIWWIQSVYVKPEFRGRGVFGALFEHVQELARARPGVCTLRLYMDKHNERARKAYGKAGLRETNYQVFELDLSQPGG